MVCVDVPVDVGYIYSTFLYHHSYLCTSTHYCYIVFSEKVEFICDQ